MTFVPFPNNVHNTSKDSINLDVRISTSTNVYATGSNSYLGTWIDLNDGDTYKIAKGSFENSAVQFRRDEVENPFLEGKYTINALRENVTEEVVVYVYGGNTMSTAEAVRNLTDAVSQTRYRMEITIEDARRSWWCYASDYTVTTTIEFMHARMAEVKIQVIRDPVEVLEEVW
jgi:hypothetical protein